MKKEKMGKIVSEVGDREETAVIRICWQYKFKVKQQSTTHTHHNLKLNAGWLYNIVQINVTE